MAYNRDITAADQVFYDTDRLLRYTIYQGGSTAAEIAAGTAIPEDVTGWALTWVLKKKVDGAALIEKATSGSGIVISGVYDADPSVNTQRVEVTIDDTDTYDPDASPEIEIRPGDYVYALKRTDAGGETILAYGKFKLLQAAAWE